MLKIKALVAVLFVFSCLFASQASADLTFTNLNVTAESFTVDVSGTVPTGSVSDPTLLLFESNPLSTDPGWVIAGGFSDGTYSFSGSQTMTQFTTGNPSFGDYIYLRLDPSLSSGDDLTGTITGTWGSDVFDPSAINSIDVYWGRISSQTGGMLVGTVNESNPPPAPTTPVPTLSAYGLILTMLGFLIVASRRLRESAKRK